MAKEPSPSPFENLRRAMRRLNLGIEAFLDAIERERLLNLSRRELVSAIHLEHDSNPILAVVMPRSDAYAPDPESVRTPPHVEELRLDEIDRKLVENHWSDVRRGNVYVVSKKLGIGYSAARERVRRLRSMGACPPPDDGCPVEPDALITNDGDAFVV